MKKHPTTRTLLRPAVAAFALALTVALTGCGTEEKPDKGTSQGASQMADKAVVVEDPWVRATKGAKDTTMTAAFMVLDNTGASAVTLTGARTSVAGRTELHEMAMVEGKSVMQQVEGGIEIGAGKGQLLQPGGMHVMLMEVSSPLAPGDEVVLTLEFADGSTLEVTAPVKAFTEEEGHYHAPGTGEHSH